MSSKLEKQLERALRAPEPSDDATARARAAAVDALPPEPPRSRRRRYGLALGIAIAAATMTATGVTLAASGTVREVVGIDEHHPPPHQEPVPPDHRPLPDGAAGFATVAEKSIWLARPGAGRVHLRADAFELSPNAVYAAVGRPGRLVIIDPATMRFVKAHRVRGTVVAIAWAPIGIRIAYIVRHDGRYALHLIEGDLSGDTVVDRSVRAITPTWRWDSLAFAYVARGDRVTVRDLEFTRTIRVRRPHCLRKLRTDQLAFAPHGTRLAVGTAAGSEAWIGDTEGGQSFCLPRGGPTVLGYNPGGGGFAWISGSELVTTPGVTLVRIRVGKTNGRIVHEVETPAGLTAIAAAPDRRSLALEFSGHNLNVMVAAIPRAGAKKVAFMRVLLHEPNPGLRRGQGAVLWR